jgi:hypothetical protein
MVQTVKVSPFVSMLSLREVRQVAGPTRQAFHGQGKIARP